MSRICVCVLSCVLNYMNICICVRVRTYACVYIFDIIFCVLCRASSGTDGRN